MADKQLSFFDLWNGFDVWKMTHTVTPSGQLIYFTLLNLWNRLGRPIEFQVTEKQMEVWTGYDRRTIRKAEDELAKNGLIDIEKGRVGRVARKIKWVINTH